MRSFTILVASAFAAFASAQVSSSVISTTFSSASAAASSAATTTSAPATTAAPVVSQSQSMPPIATAGFNPNNVTSSTKDSWCRAQQNSCRAICGGGPSVNQCDSTLLTYSCTCYNGTIPDCTRYTQTLPFFICEENRAQCIRSHPDDQAGQETCDKNAQCGTITPPTINAATTTTSGSGPSGGGSSAGAAPSSTTTSSRNLAAVYGSQASTGAFAALILAAFRFLL